MGMSYGRANPRARRSPCMKLKKFNWLKYITLLKKDVTHLSFFV